MIGGVAHGVSKALLQDQINRDPEIMEQKRLAREQVKLQNKQYSQNYRHQEQNQQNKLLVDAEQYKQLQMQTEDMEKKRTRDTVFTLLDHLHATQTKSGKVDVNRLNHAKKSNPELFQDVAAFTPITESPEAFQKIKENEGITNNAELEEYIRSPEARKYVTIIGTDGTKRVTTLEELSIGTGHYYEKEAKDVALEQAKQNVNQTKANIEGTKAGTENTKANTEKTRNEIENPPVKSMTDFQFKVNTYMNDDGLSQLDAIEKVVAQSDSKIEIELVALSKKALQDPNLSEEEREFHRNVVEAFEQKHTTSAIKNNAEVQKLESRSTELGLFEVVDGNFTNEQIRNGQSILNLIPASSKPDLTAMRSTYNAIKSSKRMLDLTKNGEEINTGFLDTFVSDFSGYIIDSDSVDKRVNNLKRQLSLQFAYAFTNDSMSTKEREDFKATLGNLNKQTKAFLGAFVESLHNLKNNLQQIKNTSSPTLYHLHTGGSAGDLNRSINKIENLIGIIPYDVSESNLTYTAESGTFNENTGSSNNTESSNNIPPAPKNKEEQQSVLDTLFR